MNTIDGYLVPREDATPEQLKALMVRLGEWLWAEEKYGIGILFDLGALTDVRDGKMPRTKHAAAGSIPIVPFGAWTLAEGARDLPGGKAAFLKRATLFFDPAIVSAISWNEATGA
jgi:hypothetical protein